MKSLGVLAGGGLALWAVLLAPGWLLWGQAALWHSAAAFLLCLVPALAAMAWALRPGTTPEMQTFAILGGTGVRLAAALGGGLLLQRAWPDVFPNVFWAWVAVFYLAALALEVVLVVRSKQSSPPAS